MRIRTHHPPQHVRTISEFNILDLVVAQINYLNCHFLTFAWKFQIHFNCSGQCLHSDHLCLSCKLLNEVSLKMMICISHVLTKFAENPCDSCFSFRIEKLFNLLHKIERQLFILLGMTEQNVLRNYRCFLKSQWLSVFNYFSYNLNRESYRSILFQNYWTAVRHLNRQLTLVHIDSNI